MVYKITPSWSQARTAREHPEWTQEVDGWTAHNSSRYSITLECSSNLSLTFYGCQNLIKSMPSLRHFLQFQQLVEFIRPLRYLRVVSACAYFSSSSLEFKIYGSSETLSKLLRKLAEDWPGFTGLDNLKEQIFACLAKGNADPGWWLPRIASGISSRTLA